MKAFLDSRLIKPVMKGVQLCAYTAGHLLMKAAIAVSLKLCMFTARVLMGPSTQSRTSQSF